MKSSIEDLLQYWGYFYARSTRTSPFFIYNSPYVAVANLAEYVKDMNPKKNDAVVYGPDGIVANA